MTGGPVLQTPADWRNLFDQLPIVGDGMISCRIGVQEVAFLTGDAVPRDGGPWAHSTVTVVNTTTGAARVVVPLAPATSLSQYQQIPDDIDGGYHWLGPAFCADNELWSAAPHNVADLTAWLAFSVRGKDWAVFPLDHMAGLPDPEFHRLESTAFDPAGNVSWGSGVWYDRGLRMVYIFGSSADPTDGWTGHDVYVARVPFEGITDRDRWQYWTGFASPGWSADPAAVAAIYYAFPAMSSGNLPPVYGLDTAYSVHHDSSGWHITSREGGMWGTPNLVRYTTPAFGQSWTRQVIAQLPTGRDEAGNDIGAYLPWEHYQLPLLADGTRPCTYNQPGQPTTWIGVPT
jgi:hypothetical protein